MAIYPINPTSGTFRSRRAYSSCIFDNSISQIKWEKTMKFIEDNLEEAYQRLILSSKPPKHVSTMEHLLNLKSERSK